MDKNKVIPLAIAVILGIVAVSLFTVNIKKNKEYSKLIISYKDSDNEYTDIKLENLIVVNNVSFSIISVSKNGMVMSSSEDVEFNKKKVSELQLNAGESHKVCFADDDCAIFRLA